jgi:hypothetical protein
VDACKESVTARIHKFQRERFEVVDGWGRWERGRGRRQEGAGVSKSRDISSLHGFVDTVVIFAISKKKSVLNIVDHR